MKTCIICEEEKDILEFYNIGDGNDFIQVVCKICRYNNLGPEVTSLEDQDAYFTYNG